MTRPRFRWTRERYYRARHLARLLPHIGSAVEPPPLVRRLFDLEARHPQLPDPLTVSIEWRYDRSDIPF